MSQIIGIGLYVFGSDVRHEDGRRWPFSSHGAACVALTRLNDPHHNPTDPSVWTADDDRAFHALLAAVT